MLKGKSHLNNGRTSSVLPFFFWGFNNRANKKGGKDSVFLSLTQSVSILFLSDPPPLRKQFHQAVVVKNCEATNPIIMRGFAVANKKRTKKYFYNYYLILELKTGLFPQIMPLSANNIYDVCR
jgi:hypothetical protein